MNVTLVVKKGELAGKEFPVSAGETVVGRSPKVQIPIPQDTKSSRRHARFMLGDSGLEVSDLGSANGTVVNGEKISGEVTLYDGDKVLVGNTLFVVKAPELSRVGPSEAAAAPLTPAAVPVKKKTAAKRAPGANMPVAKDEPQPDALAMEDTRPLVLDDGSTPAPAAASPRPASSGIDGDLGDELELDFDDSGVPVSGSAADAETPPMPAAASAPASAAALSPAEKARARARERAAAAADEIQVRKPVDIGEKPEPELPPKKESKRAGKPGTAAGDEGVDWSSRQRDILRAKGGARPNLVQRLLGDLGPITSDFGSQPLHIQMIVVLVLGLLGAGMFALGMWVFGGCDTQGGNNVRPISDATPSAIHGVDR